MIELAKVPIKSKSSIVEARNKICLLAEDLSFDPIGMIKLAVITSELARHLYQEDEISHITIGLDEKKDRIGLLLIFDDKKSILDITKAKTFFDHLSVASMKNSSRQIRGFRYIPNAMFKPQKEFIKSAREKLSRISREELLGEVENKNEELLRLVDELKIRVKKEKILAAQAAKAAEEEKRANELQKSKEELENFAERFHKLVNGAPVGMLAIDVDGKIIIVNEMSAKIFGYQPEELIGEHIEQLIPLKHRTKHIQHRKNFFCDPKIRPMGEDLDLFGLKKDGTEIPVEIALSPIQHKEKTIIAASIVDITQRRIAEDEIKRSNEELEQFAYVASHDLQEPIRKIVGFTQLFSSQFNGEFEGKKREYMDYIVDGSKRMQSLIQDLLQYSRAGTAELSYEELNFKDIVEEALTNLELLVKETNAKITYQDLPTNLKAHRNFMVRLFQNLIGNSLKYRSEESPQIDIFARENCNTWEFTIKDNGIGIDQKYAERIFIIFQRLHAKSEYSGTGIGLAVCRRMLERHKGKIWLEPHNGKGSIFKFTLPI